MPTIRIAICSLGKSIKRDTFSTDDDYHLVVEVLLLHEEDNSVLFMKRSQKNHPFLTIMKQPQADPPYRAKALSEPSAVNCAKKQV